MHLYIYKVINIEMGVTKYLLIALQDELIREMQNIHHC